MTTMTDLERTYAHLQRRLDELEGERDNARARVAELEEALFRPDFRVPPEWRLRRQEVTLLGALIASGDAVLTRGAMMSALYGSDDWATPKILDVIMCKMRTKLKPHGITVETVWGRGYRLSRQARERSRPSARRATRSFARPPRSIGTAGSPGTNSRGGSRRRALRHEGERRLPTPPEFGETGRRSKDQLAANQRERPRHQRTKDAIGHA